MLRTLKNRLHFRKEQAWWEVNRQKGVNPLTLLLVGMPMQILRRVYAVACELFNNTILYPINKFAIIRFHRQHSLQQSSGHYYIIVVPNALHLLLPCVMLLKTIRIVFIVNGANRKDVSHLVTKFPTFPHFRLYTMPWSYYTHGKVLNLLFAANHGNFGIVDHDLFLFRSQILQDIQLDDKTALAHIYSHTNPKTGLSFPTTHFMYFNTPLLKNLMHRYRISALHTHIIPKKISKQIESLGFSYDNLPKSWLKYFDTMQIMIAMCHYDGCAFRQLELAADESVHIGQVTSGVNNLPYLWLYARLLELPCNDSIKSRYWKKLIRFDDQKKLLDHIKKQSGELSQLAYLNGVVNRIQQHIEMQDNGMVGKHN